MQRRKNEVFTEEEEKAQKAKLKMNSSYFHNNFVRASWIPNELLTDLRNWHSPMIRDWTYKGHTRAGQHVGLTECLPRRYNFVDIMRTSRSANSLPPSFHKMPDLSTEHVNQLKSHTSLEMRELSNMVHENFKHKEVLKRVATEVDSGINSMLRKSKPFKSVRRLSSTRLGRTPSHG
jgi:hypothetical protein